MGYPVNSFDRMEAELRMQQYNRPTKWTIVILCNGRSNNKAARQIFNNFNILDIVSDEINFFLPGYETTDMCNQGFQTLDCQVQDLERINRDTYKDYHYDSPFDVVMSRRLGPIVFNDAAFANFVKELSLRCKGYSYSGRSELIILPLNEGTPIYDKFINLPLDPLCGDTRMSLDQFLHEAFNILRRERIESTIPFFARLFYRDRTLDEITNLYYEATNTNIARYANEIKYELDQDILRHMKWNKGDKFFFISYSSEDTLEAMALRSCLESEGYKVWIAPDGIPQGRDYISVIPASIRMCKRFILLLSSSSANSSWVRNEVSTAISCRCSVNVLLTKDYDIESMRRNESMKFMLDGCQIRYRLEEVLRDEGMYQSFLHD